MINRCLIVFCISSIFTFQIITSLRYKKSSGLLPRISLNADGQFVDNNGRHIMFHGINNVQKGFPWYDQNILNTTILQYYKQWGFNFVRLGAMWSGVMINESHINMTYVQTLQKIVDQLDEYGMYSMLDMHQDVISTKFSSYDGVPRWLIDKFPDSLFSYPWPFKEPLVGADWEMGYLTMAVGVAFQNLYENYSNAWNNWADFWKVLASNFNMRESVIGYELINEPWAGDVYGNPTRFLPGVAGKTNLLPVYDYLVNQIRKIDQKTLIFYEPVTWGAYGWGSGTLGSGFDHTPNHDPSRSVLSYHYYCWLINSDNSSTLYPSWKRIFCDDLALADMYRAVKKDLNVTGGGAMLTEFGLCAPDKSNKSINTIECEQVLIQAESNLQSWAYWDSIFFDNHGNPIDNTVRAFARPYPRATAGTVLIMQFDSNTGYFEMQYMLNISMSVPTVIFLPVSVHYQNGYVAMTNPNMTLVFRQEDSVLEVSVPRVDFYINDFVVEIVIKPKSG